MTPARLRQIIHVSSAALLLGVPLGSWDFLRATLMAVAVLALAVDAVRISIPGVHQRLCDWIPVFRPEESRRLSGAAWLFLGYGIAGWFPPPAPAAGVLVGALADPVASLAGSSAAVPGRKTWRGTGAAAVTAAGVLWLLGIPWPAIVAGAGAAALLERWPGPFNDNLVVAPAVALAVWVLA